VLEGGLCAAAEHEINEERKGQRGCDGLEVRRPVLWKRTELAWTAQLKVGAIGQHALVRLHDRYSMRDGTALG
jgi:hypothetical protein